MYESLRALYSSMVKGAGSRLLTWEEVEAEEKNVVVVGRF